MGCHTMATQRAEKLAETLPGLPEPLETNIATWLRPPFLRDAAKGIATLHSIAAVLPDVEQTACWLPWLAKEVRSAFDPDRALNNWERFFHACPGLDGLLPPSDTSSRLPTALTTLFGGSQYLTDMILQEPSIVEWLDAGERPLTSRSKEA